MFDFESPLGSDGSCLVFPERRFVRIDPGESKQSEQLNFSRSQAKKGEISAAIRRGLARGVRSAAA